LKANVGRVKPGRVQKKAGGISRSKSNAGSRINFSVVIVIAKNCSRQALANHCDVDLVAGKREGGLLIGSVLDIDDSPVCAVAGNSVEGGLDIRVVPRPVLGDDNVIAGLGQSPIGG